MQRGALQLLSTTPRRLRLDERHAAQLARYLGGLCTARLYIDQIVFEDTYLLYLLR